MPMLYVVQNGGNFVDHPTRAEDIVYLVCSLNTLVESDHTCYFSDGHATDNFTTFYDKTHLNDLPDIIDWEAIKTQYWGGNENLDLKRKKQAEFLVAEDINPSFLIGFVCYNQAAANRLKEFGIQETKIKVLPNCYYDIL